MTTARVNLRDPNLSSDVLDNLHWEAYEEDLGRANLKADETQHQKHPLPIEAKIDYEVFEQNTFIKGATTMVTIIVHGIALIIKAICLLILVVMLFEIFPAWVLVLLVLI